MCKVFWVYTADPCMVVEYAWVELNEQIIDPTPHLNKMPMNFTAFQHNVITVKQLKQQ